VIGLSEHAEWKEEQQRVDRVMGVIRTGMEELEERLGTIKEQVVDIRKHFWDDVTVNLDEPDDQIESYFSLKQQAELLSERERSHRNAQQLYTKLRRLNQSTYFGRIDFQEAGSPSETIYLGVGSLLDEQGDTFLVYDWRAPISSLYYDYGPGPAVYETPSGMISGEMELKRQFIIRDGIIRYMFDTGITIGDEILQQVLGQGADAQMKNIVATIQREQNRIIRNDGSRMLIVTGPAGSGKTSAALQRVAYLLYKYRHMLTAEQIVLFSPNPMFNRYISTVLPELGEENMEQTTYQEYLEHRLGGRFQLEDPFQQMEDVLTRAGQEGHEARLDGITFKASAAFFDAIQAYKSELEVEGLQFKNVTFRGQVLVPADQIRERFYTPGSTAKLAPRIDSVVQWLEDELESAMIIERGKPWVQEEMDLLEPEDFQKAFRQLRKESRQRRESFNERQREDELLRDLVVRRHFKKLTARVRALRFIDIPATYRRLFEDLERVKRLMVGAVDAVSSRSDIGSTDAASASVPGSWEDICRQTIQRLDQGKLAYEDATPYLYLQEMIVGFQMNMNIRHVIVDEAQDYSPFQYEYLKKMFPRARMTALGDLNQAIYAHSSSLPSLEALTDLYGSDWTETIRLTQTYRSTRPIVEFTRQLLLDGRDIEPFNRDGLKPTVTVVDGGVEELHQRIADRLQLLLDEGFNTIAVIGKTEKECRIAQEGLAGLGVGQGQDNEPLRLITKESASFEKGIAVIPSYLAKGIEFDAVIIYDASSGSYSRELERKLFYTACTRAMHQLHLYSNGPISPFVESVDPSSYVAR
jgi:DNA helicase II / ATP-dependent DNA helicase PcrA